jgi:hypothetical protein
VTSFETSFVTEIPSDVLHLLRIQAQAGHLQLVSLLHACTFPNRLYMYFLTAKEWGDKIIDHG